MAISAAMGSEKFIRNGNIRFVEPEQFQSTAVTSSAAVHGPIRCRPYRMIHHPSTASAMSPAIRYGR